MAKQKLNDRIFPILTPIPGLSSTQLQRDMERIHREFNEHMEADRRAVRIARAADPHRCHCPHCTVIG